MVINPLDDGRAPDVIGHLRRLVRAAVPAGVVAAVVGLAAVGYLLSVKPTYTATVIAQIDAQIPVVSGDAYLYQMTAPYLALAESQEVRQATAHEMGIDWDPDRVRDSVLVTVSKSPLLLEVSGSSPDRAEALRLALTTVRALDGQSRAQRRDELQRAIAAPSEELASVAQQIAAIDDEFLRTWGYRDPTADGDPQRAALAARADELGAQINRIREAGVNGLSVLSAPDVDAVAPSAPLSTSVVLFTVVVVFIVTAEALVFLRGRFGRRLTEASADRIARTRRIALEVRDAAAVGFPPVTAGLLARRSGRGQKTMLVVTPEAEEPVRTWLDDGDEVAFVDVEHIDSGWPAKLTDAIGLVIIVARSGEGERVGVDHAARTLAELGIPRRLVMVTSEATSVREAEAGVQIGADT
ncbi:hypothetical protein [Mycobacterium sp. ACS4331]|uniref:hypothetical protein n=1 Tax=Mycobacterium sp. ACS4331 TaxID=1834121 RepID=UPI00080141D6|nr:hypothetical protein [Mycobacterium sp. ACS4331]OBF27945.1 hypothetical protein A5727_02360 [Mycobacterium sp. ACS4331]